jgi:O-acetyl-ADP-ribose deacetylase (regulator of RNase III)
MPIQFVVGDATLPQGEGAKVIVHVCNDAGGWGRGFVVAISRRWSLPEAEYRRWHREPQQIPFELGQVQFVEVDSGLWVANMIGQHDVRPSGGVPPVRYEAIRTGLGRVREFAVQRQASIHMPRIGAGLAGGSWETIQEIIEQELSELSVLVYDFPR